MPCISDPGEDLVRLCAEYQIETRVVPGPSAVISALCVSGLVTSRFSFEGFLSTNKRSRLEHLTSIRKDTHTLIFYEAPHKLLSTLKDLYETLGDRKISLVKEITKLHESVNRTTLAQAVQYYTENTPKGEFVLVLEGAVIAENNEEEMTLEQAVQLAKELMEQGHRPSDAAKEAAKLTQFKKAEIYKQLID